MIPPRSLIKASLVCALVSTLGCASNTETQSWQAIDIQAFNDSINHARMKYPNGEPTYTIYQTDQITEIGDNLLAGQNRDGGWSKNKDWLRVYSQYEMNILQYGASTLDNRTTWSQIDYLAKVYQQTKQQKYADSAIKGIEYILNEQRESGGWRGHDVEAITYNDNVMTGVLKTLKSVLENRDRYRFVDPDLLARVQQAYDKGLACVLATQVRIDGKLTAWAQQHDHKTLEPIWARSFEPPAISSSESVAVVRFLMTIKNPSSDIKTAITSAVTWLDKVKIENQVLEKIPAPEIHFKYHWSNYDFQVVEQKGAKPMWSRYYDLQTQQPIFCTRKSVITTNYQDVGRERRTGYSWYGYYANKLIEKEYPAWQIKWSSENQASGTL